MATSAKCRFTSAIHKSRHPSITLDVEVSAKIHFRSSVKIKIYGLRYFNRHFTCVSCPATETMSSAASKIIVKLSSTIALGSTLRVRLVLKHLNHRLNCRRADILERLDAVYAPTAAHVPLHFSAVTATVDLYLYLQCRQVDNFMFDDHFRCRHVDVFCSTHSLPAFLCADFRKIRHRRELL